MSAPVSTRGKTADMAYIAIFAIVIAVCSWISIPTMVPFTLQTFGVFLAIGILGGKRGTMAVLVYMLLGAIGIPVFSGFSAGIGYILGGTGGYILGFILSALVMWAMENLLGKATWVYVLSMVLGLLVCYAFGTIWFMVVYAKNSGAIGVWTALTWCVFPYVIPDILKIILALSASKRLARIIRIV